MAEEERDPIEGEEEVQEEVQEQAPIFTTEQQEHLDKIVSQRLGEVSRKKNEYKQQLDDVRSEHEQAVAQLEELRSKPPAPVEQEITDYDATLKKVMGKVDGLEQRLEAEARERETKEKVEYHAKGWEVFDHWAAKFPDVDEQEAVNLINKQGLTSPAFEWAFVQLKRQSKPAIAGEVELPPAATQTQTGKGTRGKGSPTLTGEELLKLTPKEFEIYYQKGMQEFGKVLEQGG